MLILIIILLSFGIAAYFYPQMPEQMVSHWNASGQPDGYMGKFGGLFLMPIITLAMYLLFIIMPKIDPLKKNIEKFRVWFDSFMLIFILFFYYIYSLTIIYNFGVEFDMTKAILPAMGVLFFFIGYVLEHAKRNWFIGIRTPWTLSNDAVWDKTHVLGSKLFKIVGVITVLGILLPVNAFAVIITAIILAAIVPVVYSYFEFKKLK